MRPGHNGGKKMGMKRPVSTPASRTRPAYRKIPEKPRGPRWDEEALCGKEMRRDAAKSQEAEDSQ